MLLKMKLLAVQYGILISVFILLVLIVKILYFSTKNNFLLELVHNEISHKNNYNSTNGYNTETRQKPIIMFREEFKFYITDPELHQDRYVRVKRDEAGTLQAQNIQAGRINTNKMYAKHIMADIVKASKVKARIISTGKAFLVHKTNNPTGSPDKLILDRDGPDLSDSSVTIVLEREGHPVSIKGHSMHEEEKHKLLKINNSFVVKEKSRNRNDLFDRFPARRRSHWRNNTRRTRQQTVVPSQINHRKAHINREKNSVYDRNSKSTNVFSNSNMNRIIPAPRTRLLTNSFKKSESNRLMPAQITRAPMQFEKQNQDAAQRRNTLQDGQIPLIPKFSSAIKLSTTIQPASQVQRKLIFERRNSIPMPIPNPRLIVNTGGPRTKNQTVQNFKDKNADLRRKNSVTGDSDSSDFDSFDSNYLSDWDSDRGSKLDESDYFDSDSDYDSEWSSEHDQDRKLPLKASDKATALQNRQIGHNHPFKASNEHKLLRNKTVDKDFKTESDESGVYDDHESSDELYWSNENEKELKNVKQKSLSVSDNQKEVQPDVSEDDSSDYEYYSYESSDLSDIKKGATTARSEKINRENNSVYDRNSKSKNVFSSNNMNRIIPAPRTWLLTNNLTKSESNRLMPAQITRAQMQFEKQNQDAAQRRNTLQDGQIPLIQKLSSATKLSTIQPATQVQRKLIFERRNFIPMPKPDPRLIVNTDRPRTKNPTVPNVKDKNADLRRKNSVKGDSDNSDFDSFDSNYLLDWDSDRGSKWDESDYFDSDSDYDSEWSSEHDQDRKLPLKASDKATTLQNRQISHNHPLKASNEPKLLRNKTVDKDFKTESDESGVYDDHESSDELYWSNENEKETKIVKKTHSVSDNPKEVQPDVSDDDSSDYEYYSYESSDLSDIKKGPTTARGVKINRENNFVYGRNSKSKNVFSSSNMDRIIPAPRTWLLTNNLKKNESNRLMPAQITRAPMQFEKQNQDAAQRRNTLQDGQIPLIQKLSSAIKLSTIQPATQVQRKLIFERRNFIPMPKPDPRLIVNTDRPRTKNPTVQNVKDKNADLRRKNSVKGDSDNSDFDSFDSNYLLDWDSDRGSKWDESNYFDSGSDYDSEWSSEHGQDRKLPLKVSDKATTLQNRQIGHNHPLKASNEPKLLRNIKVDKDFKTDSDESGVYDDHEISDEWDWSNENEKETKNSKKTLPVSDNPNKVQLDVSENDSSDYEYYSYKSNDLSDIKKGPTTARSVNSVITTTSQKRRKDFDYDSSPFEYDGERLYSKKAPETDYLSYEDDGERLYSKKTPATISIQKTESSNKSKFVSVKFVNIYKKKSEESDEWDSSNNFDKDVSTRKSLSIDKSEYIQKAVFKTKSEDKEKFFSDSAEEWFKDEYSFSDEFYSSEEFGSDKSAKDVTKNYKNNKNKSY